MPNDSRSIVVLLLYMDNDLIIWKYIYNEHVYDVYNYEALPVNMKHFKYNEGVIV